MSNLKKHGIDFDTASRVFLDPYHICIEDTYTDASEERFIAVGAIDLSHSVVMVVHTYLQDDAILVIRIISARKLSQGEVKRYGYG